MIAVNPDGARSLISAHAGLGHALLKTMVELEVVDADLLQVCSHPELCDSDILTLGFTETYHGLYPGRNPRCCAKSSCSTGVYISTTPTLDSTNTSSSPHRCCRQYTICHLRRLLQQVYIRRPYQLNRSRQSSKAACLHHLQIRCHLSRNNNHTALARLPQLLPCFHRLDVYLLRNTRRPHNLMVIRNIRPTCSTVCLPQDQLSISSNLHQLRLQHLPPVLLLLLLLPSPSCQKSNAQWFCELYK